MMADERKEAVRAMTDVQIVAQASRIITIAMGTEKNGRGRGKRTVYRADADPLAFWLGVEAILDLIHAAALPASTGEGQ